MGNSIKKLEFDCVNRIKYEKREKFEESLFADVYERAARLVTLIIEESFKETNEDILDESFCTEERFNNNISFWGERGMGKSSAMLSFALFLKKYDHSIEDKFHLNIKRQPEFYVLPRIDAAMLVKGEYVLDVILAKMWSAFEEKANVGLMQNGRLNETKKYFGDVKKSYESYRKTISGEEKYEMTSVRQLKELSKCLNLKEDFKRLVESFLACMLESRDKTGFLVLAIDDLDVVVDDVNNILEQIRLFLSVPKVIVLATADYGRLFLDCNKSFSDRLICSENVDYLERKQIRGYSEKYLAKIFPSNMRVYMPRINVAGGVDYNVKIPEGSEFLADEQETFDEKRLLFIMLAKYTKIMMYPFDKHRHFLQKTSLRGIVNELYELEKMHTMEEQGRFEAACLWIQTALIEEGKTIMNTWEYQWAQAVLGGNSVNETVVEILALREEQEQRQKEQNETKLGYGQMLREQGEDEWTGYGQMLKLLVKLLESSGHEYRDFVHFALIFYSVQIARILRSDDKEEDIESLYIKDVFYPLLEAAAYKRGDRPEKSKLDSLPSDSLAIKKAIPSDDIQKFFEINHDKIYKAFKLANLCEWNLWNEDDDESTYIQFKASEGDQEETVMKSNADAPQEETAVESNANVPQEETAMESNANAPQEETAMESNADAPQEEAMIENIVNETQEDKSDSRGIEEKTNTLIATKTINSRVSIEILLWNSLYYEEHLKGFCRNIYSALCALKKKKIENIQMEKEIENIISNPEFHISEYREWKKSVKDIDSLLPWQSAEVMLHLAEEMGKVQQPVSGDDLLKRILSVQQRQMDRVIQEMKSIEEYYQPLFNKKKSYSEILESYLRIMEPYIIDKEVGNNQTIPSKTAV